MSKKFIFTAVECPGEPDSDAPVACMIELSEETVKRLNETRELLECHNLYSAELECHSIRFTGLYPDFSDDIAKVIQQVADTELHMTVPMFLVTKRYISVTAYQKNLPDRFMVRTKEFSFDDLIGNNEPLFIEL